MSWTWDDDEGNKFVEIQFHLLAADMPHQLGLLHQLIHGTDPFIQTKLFPFIQKLDSSTPKIFVRKQDSQRMYTI